MANPEFKMKLGSPGEEIEYCRRMVEASSRGTDVATYAPYGVTEREFNRLVVDAVMKRKL